MHGIGIIVLGLSLRRFGYDLGLPFLIVKFGGSLLWGAMVYFLVGFMLPTGRWPLIAGVAMTLATFIECSRLYHTSELDAFRLTTAGALLLGRVFSIWNIAAYAGGIALAVAMEARNFGGRFTSTQ
jgi:hypothetical protein